MSPDSPSLVTNPLLALTVMVGPAILTNACSVLALGTSNRLARVVDRTRVVVTDLGGINVEHSKYARWMNQLQSLDARTQLLLRSLRAFYAALGLFATGALLSAVGSVISVHGQHLAFRIIALAALASGAAAVAGLVSGCVGMVRETRYAVQALEQEAGLRASRGGRSESARLRLDAPQT